MEIHKGFLSFSTDPFTIENTIGSPLSHRTSDGLTRSTSSDLGIELKVRWFNRNEKYSDFITSLMQHSFVVGHFYCNRKGDLSDSDQSENVLILSVLLRVRFTGERSAGTPIICCDGIYLTLVDALSTLFTCTLREFELQLFPISDFRSHQSVGGNATAYSYPAVPFYAISESRLLKLRPCYINSRFKNDNSDKMFTLSDIRDKLLGQAVFSLQNTNEICPICKSCASVNQYLNQNYITSASQCTLGRVNMQLISETTSTFVHSLGPVYRSSSCECLSKVDISIVTRNTQLIIVDNICLSDSFYFLDPILAQFNGKSSFHNSLIADSLTVNEDMNILDNHVKFEEYDIDIASNCMRNISIKNISSDESSVIIESLKQMISDQLKRLLDNDIFSLLTGIVSKGLRLHNSPNGSSDRKTPCLLLIGNNAKNFVTLVSYSTSSLVIRINASKFLLRSRMSDNIQDIDSNIVNMLSESINSAIRLQAKRQKRGSVLLFWENVDELLGDPSTSESEMASYKVKILLQRVGSLIKELHSSKSEGLSIVLVASVNPRKAGQKFEYLKDLFVQCIEIPKLSLSSCHSMIKSIMHIIILCKANKGRIPSYEIDKDIDYLKKFIVSKFDENKLDFNEVCNTLTSGYLELLQKRFCNSNKSTADNNASDDISLTISNNSIDSGARNSSSSTEDLWGTGVVGLADVKRNLVEAIFWPRIYASVFNALKCPAPVGILLHGPPGTGKTLLPRTLSQQSVLKVSFYSIKLSDVVKGYIGEGERLLHSTFAMAKSTSPSILFIDEFQAVFSDRDSSERDVVGSTLTSTLLSCLDGIALWNNAAAMSANRNSAGATNGNFVTIIASTNALWGIDKAFLRSGRFDRQVFVGPLSIEDRVAFVRRILEDLNSNIIASTQENLDASNELSILEEIIFVTEGFTGADFSKLKRNIRIALSKRKDNKLTRPELLQFIVSILTSKKTISSSANLAQSSNIEQRSSLSRDFNTAFSSASTESNSKISPFGAPFSSPFDPKSFINAFDGFKSGNTSSPFVFTPTDPKSNNPFGSVSTSYDPKAIFDSFNAFNLDSKSKI